MKVWVEEVVQDRLLADLGRSDTRDFLEKFIPRKLADCLANEIVKHYIDDVRREGTLKSRATSFRLGLHVFNDDELQKFLSFHIDQENRKNERNKA